MKDNDKIFAHIQKKLQQCEANSSTWHSNQDKYHRLRMRIKKNKNFPFVGCSNIRMPTGETKIRKLKAALTNVIFGIRPIVQAIPTPSGSMDAALKIEKFMDYLLMQIAKIKPRSVIAIDQALEKGFFLIKSYYRVETTTRLETFKLEDMETEELIQFFDPDKSEDDLTQLLLQVTESDTCEKVIDENTEACREAVRKALDGDESIDIMLKDVLYDSPDIELVSPEDFYSPTDGGYDVQKLEHCGHTMFKSFHEIKQNAVGKGWDTKALEDIEAFKDANPKNLTESTKNMREGIERLNNPSNYVKLVEWYEWYDLNGDGEPEKCVFTLAPEFNKVLRAISLPFDHGRWPFVKVYYELTDDRWFSHRGVIELIEDIIKEIDIQHMQKLDQQTIRNTPMFVYRAGMVNPNLVQFIPNQGIPIHGMNDLRNTIDILNNNNPNVEFSYEKEEQILLGRIEECLGQTDFTLQSQVNRREPRTFGEVNLQNQAQQQVFSLDASLLTETFTDLFQMMWSDWCQFGPEKVEFEYFGDRWENIRLTREELQGQYKIIVRGNDQNTNPQVRLQKAQTIIMGATNPIALQTGVVTPQHLANAYRLFYHELDVQNPELYYNAQPVPQQPPPPQPLPPDFEEMTDAEKAQVLAKYGVQPDIPGRALNKEQELMDKDVERQKGASDAKRKKEGSK